MSNFDQSNESIHLYNQYLRSEARAYAEGYKAGQVEKLSQENIRLRAALESISAKLESISANTLRGGWKR